MLKRPFGASGLEVSALGLGAGPLGDDRIDDAAVVALLDAALDAGINLIDTAPSYGRSEERIGRYIADAGCRDELILATKFGYGIEGVEDWTGLCIERGVDRALRLLGVERIDVGLLHSCSPDILARGDVVVALERAVAAGKLRMFGYSGDGDGLRAARSIPGLSAFEASVSMVDQEVLTDTLPAPTILLAKRALMNAVFAVNPAGRPDLEELRRRYDALPPDLRDGDVAGRALRFAAFEPGVTCTLVGTTKVAHLRAAIDAVAAGPLPVVERNAIHDTWAAHRWPGLI